MAQTTPKIRSFTLANVSAELSLKKYAYSRKLSCFYIENKILVGCSFSLAQNPHLILNGAYPTPSD